MKNLISIYDDFCDYVDEELKRYYTYRKNNLLIDKYCEEEKGKNVPYKIALLDEIGIFKLKGHLRTSMNKLRLRL